MLNSTDAGDKWFPYNSGLTEQLQSIYFINDSMGWITGENGGILATTDGGLNWNTQPSQTENSLLSVFFISDSNGWIAGENGVILNTTNAGMNCDIQNTPITEDWLFSIHFISEKNGWAVGGKGIILETTNARIHWSVLPHLTYEELRSTHFINTSGWCVVSNGVMFSALLSPNNVYETYKKPESDLRILLQNYPNPFNPSTEINYQLPSHSMVTLIVYNVLGSEITTNVNEEKNAGNYNIKFNTSNLPSGVYFYMLKAGNFVKTKKMILMKSHHI